MARGPIESWPIVQRRRGELQIVSSSLRVALTEKGCRDLGTRSLRLAKELLLVVTLPLLLHVIDDLPKLGGVITQIPLDGVVRPPVVRIALQPLGYREEKGSCLACVIYRSVAAQECLHVSRASGS